LFKLLFSFVLSFVLILFTLKKIPIDDDLHGCFILEPFAPKCKKRGKYCIVTLPPCLKKQHGPPKKKAAWFDKTPTNDYVF
jgi:hypothetical protein